MYIYIWDMCDNSIPIPPLILIDEGIVKSESYSTDTVSCMVSESKTRLKIVDGGNRI